MTEDNLITYEDVQRIRDVLSPDEIGRRSCDDSHIFEIWVDRCPRHFWWDGKELLVFGNWRFTGIDTKVMRQFADYMLKKGDYLFHETADSTLVAILNHSNKMIDIKKRSEMRAALGMAAS